MSSSPTPVERKPEPRIAVQLPDAQRTLFMSFGLLNELAALVGGAEAVPQLSFHAPTARTALELVLAPRDKHGNIPPQTDDDAPIVPVDLAPEAAEAILDWVAAHVLDFFIRRFAKSAKLFAEQAINLGAVGSSLTSSVTSAGKTP